jgi:hypothetical protein
MTSMDRTRPRRRWLIAALAVLVALAGLFAALPQLVNRTVARRILTARAGQLLAPGSLEAAAVRVSWSNPTEIDGAVLRDKRGNGLITTPRAVIDWNLWQILFHPRDTATLEMPGAALEIERLPDGRIDLYETLEPIIRAEPDLRLIVEIPGGRLRFRDPALAEPFQADRADIRLDIPRGTQPVEWNVELGRNADDGRQPSRFVSRGSIHRPGDGGATISLEASRWPCALKIAGVATRGELDVRLGAERREARWSVNGQATATHLASTGGDAKTGGDPDRFGPVQADWDLQGEHGTWTARQLAVTIPYARIEGTGTIEGITGTPRVDLKGSLAPDWDAIQAAVRTDVEPNARIAGRPWNWRVSGSLGDQDAQDRLAGLVVELGIQLDAVDIFGMRLSQTAIVLRGDGGRFRFDPIDAKLNEGTLHLEPEIVRPKEGPLRIKLGAASTLKDAVVNDEVSHRVLSYVAPVLDGATRVRGRVSMQDLDAEFPLSDAPGAAAKVEGNVLFDDVRFLPGPLAQDIIDLLPRPAEAEAGAEPMLVLRDPIAVRIADRKVYQRGMNVPIGRVGSVAVEGSVDFEKRLDLLARFRINPPRADRPVIAALLNNARFELPIRGTLDDPQIDEEALKERLKSMGSDLLGNSIFAGTEGLLRLLERLPRRREARKPPADAPDVARPQPPPPPRPTAEERREIRQQRRAERLEKKAQKKMQREQKRSERDNE